MEQNSIERQVLEWIATDDHGISSMAMAYAAMGMIEKLDDNYHPVHVGDLGRCVRLVDQIEGIESGFNVLRGMSVQWRNVIDHWEELSSSYKSELEQSGSDGSERLPKTRALLDSIVEGEQAAS